MRYLVIHSKGYGGEGPWSVDFEIEAETPDAPVEATFAHDGAEDSEAWVKDVETLLQNFPDLTAGDVALRTGGQNIGLLAEKETGQVVFKNGEDVDDPYYWDELNQPDALEIAGEDPEDVEDENDDTEQEENTEDE